MTDHMIEASHLDAHLDWMRRCGRSPRTVDARIQVIEKIGRVLGHDPATATLDELEHWQMTLPSLDNLRWSTGMARPYYRWLRDRGYREDNPAAQLAMPAQHRKIPRPIPEDRLAQAVANASPRLQPWLLLAGWSGLRAAEIAAVTRKAFSINTATGQHWLMVQGKGDRERQVPIPEWAWDVIDQSLPASGQWMLLYKPLPITARHVSRYCCQFLHQQGFPDNLHSLRHRAATEVLRNTRNLRLVQDLLGHAKLDQLTVYTKVQASEVGDAVNALRRPAQTLTGTH